MSSKTSNKVSPKTGSKRRMPERDTEEYREKRDRNNEAVKKSRDKSKYSAKQTGERVKKLRKDNEELEKQLVTLSKELGVLKDLFKMVHTTKTEEETITSTTQETPKVTQTWRVQPNGDCLKVDNTSMQPIKVNIDALLKDHEYSSPGKQKA